MKAQGNALGSGKKNKQPRKGATSVVSPLQGDEYQSQKPGAVPRAFELGSFGAGTSPNKGGLKTLLNK
jgi:hypothetical protein